ncbi:hypothetical protein INS49_007744 [Diaporthe citri]|uniref:uncharacterized protein n=1 Tax=Diaporthe citri TaxID=83186 RepID=UPI001C80CA3C|nr:uncharacterized protein INS49_007744 [Diaporthe citri]KAG6362652.1 hypothetical protein INS49_007744 [Diaporthe citri]
MFSATADLISDEPTYVHPAPCPDTLIVQIAQWLEHLAETDENFDVARYGDKFLRQFCQVPAKPLPQPPLASKVSRKPACRRDGDDEHDSKFALEYTRKESPKLTTISAEKQAQPRHSEWQGYGHGKMNANIPTGDLGPRLFGSV